jgi:hypothetical protein
MVIEPELISASRIADMYTETGETLNTLSSYSDYLEAQKGRRVTVNS